MNIHVAWDGVGWGGAPPQLFVTPRAMVLCACQFVVCRVGVCSSLCLLRSRMLVLLLLFPFPLPRPSLGRFRTPWFPPLPHKWPPTQTMCWMRRMLILTTHSHHLLLTIQSSWLKTWREYMSQARNPHPYPHQHQLQHQQLH